MNTSAVALALGDARCEGRTWRCRCPLHNGRSLIFRDGDGGCVTCWGGCDRRDVLAELRRRKLLDATDYWRLAARTSQQENVARKAGTAIDIDGAVLGTFDTLREPTLAFPEREGMR
jgi:hypothetical protein